MTEYVCKQPLVPSRNNVSQYGVEPSESSTQQTRNKHTFLSAHGITNSYENAAIEWFLSLGSVSLEYAE